MGKLIRKIHEKENYLLIAAFMMLVMTIILPASGKIALLDELCEALLFWLIFVYVFVKLTAIPKAKTITVRILKISAIAVCLLLSLWFTKDFACDAVSGTKSEVVYEPKLERAHNFAGILSMHYYLNGTTEDGKPIQVELSSKDFSALQASSAEKLSIKYFKYSGRLYTYIVRK